LPIEMGEKVGIAVCYYVLSSSLSRRSRYPLPPVAFSHFGLQFGDLPLQVNLSDIQIAQLLFFFTLGLLQLMEWGADRGCEAGWRRLEAGGAPFVAELSSLVPTPRSLDTTAGNRIEGDGLPSDIASSLLPHLPERYLLLLGSESLHLAESSISGIDCVDELNTELL
jgi:hypothetical protein